MGSSPSVFSAQSTLSDEQYNSLTASFRNRFQDRGQELLNTQGMSDIEIHMSLTLFYSNLMEELRIRNYDQAQTVKRERRERDELAKQKARDEQVWNGDCDAKLKLERRRQLHDMYSVAGSKDLEDIENKAAQPVVKNSSKLVTDDSWTPSRTSDKPTDGYHNCTMCKKKFTFEWQLKMHNGHSPIHAHNIAQRELQFAQAMHRSTQLFDLVKTGVSLFTDTKARSSPSETMASVPRARWRAALAKIIQRQTYEKYRAFISDFGTADVSTSAVSTLYSGSKFFWRAQENVGVHIFLHHKHNTIEVVSQFFSMPIESIDGAMPLAGSVSSLMHGQRVTSIYLAYHLLLAQTVAKKKEKVLQDEWTRSSRGRFERTKCSEEALTSFGNEGVVEYVLDSINLAGNPGMRFLAFTWQSPAANPEHPRYLELLSANELIDPNMLTKPQGLVPVKIDAAKLNQLWQVEQAMSAVEASSQELATNVRRAENLALVLESSIQIFKAKAHTSTQNCSANTNAAPCSIAKQRFQRIASRMVRIIQVGKMAARLEGIERRGREERARLKKASSDSQDSPKSIPYIPWIRVREKGGGMSPTFREDGL